ncbi:MAG: efflux RND transporter permease subunit [Lentihominibacter sp.]|uniref:efflux RND transporter permease subunit n=1 Tax=Lentihominibacter sp. TaxID=2944216 RepID=UPI002A91AE49|nr:efflux RND transporter permease subunit [Lentihominibacter sp.]MDY5286158.1 efflux RND transporter permease subunit [Lentihominibacter sp.]
MLSKFSIKKPFTVLVAVVIVIVFGVIALTKMTPDLFPKINTPYVIVMTAYPGASPEEAEEEITKPMEQQMATLSNIKNVTSVSAANYSMIQLEFSDSVNMDSVSVDIREKIDQIEGNLPDTAGTPVVMKISMDMMPVVTAAVGMEDKSSGEVSQFTKDNLQSPLEGVEGVASVSTMGMVDDNIQIVLSQDKIDAINKEVAAAINKQMGDAEGQMKSGMAAAKSGKKQIQDGKKAVKDGQSQAAKQLAATKTKLQESRDQLVALKQNGPAIKALYEQYKKYKDDPIMGPQIESQLKALGIDPASLDQIVPQIDQADAQLKQIDKALEELDSQGSAMNFELGSKYADLTSAEGTVESTVNQLQSALSQLQSSKEAALASADMTGVITMQNISAILSEQNFSMPAGYITDGKAEVLVSVGDKIKNKDELENLILFDMGIDGVDPIRLSDVATVTYTDDDAETYAKINGNNGVLLSFTKQSSYATADVSANISDKFAQLEKEYKDDDLSFTTLYDQGDYIHIVINSVLQNLLLGAILAILILLVFLRDLRPTIITAVSIPLSVIFAIVLMYFSGVTLNMISLAGLAIGVGMLVDNSIVVVENIYRLRSMGYSRVQAAVSGAVQVAGAITASTLTTICVFVPIIFVDGMTRDIFTDLALTVAYSLLASLLIALTVVPAMAKGLLKKETRLTALSQTGRFMDKYRTAVRWALSHRAIVLIAAVVLLVGSSGLALMRGLSFMPSMSTPQISATIQMPKESTLKETSDTTDKIVKEVRKVDGVETVGAMLSSNTMSMMGMSGTQDVTSTMVYVILNEDKADNGKIIAKKMDKLAKKYNCEIVTSADMDMSSMMGGSGVDIKLYSEDLTKLRSAGIAIESKLKGMKSLEDVSTIDEDSSEELHVVVNKNLAMKQGLTVAQVYQQISAKLTKESTATTLSESDTSMDVVVENSTNGKFTREDLENMKLTTSGGASSSAAGGSSAGTGLSGGAGSAASGGSASASSGSSDSSEVTLSSIADIQTTASLSEINHDNQKRSLSVTASVKDGYNITHVNSDVQKMIKKEKLIPSGVKVDYGGENEEIMHSMKQMMLMLLVGLILVYLVMVAQFQSLRSPFIVIFTIPLAFTGGMLALLICGQDVSVVSMMGFVMLMGVVVNNAIVLVDCINRFRLEGIDMESAVIEAGAVRMRPVLMTAITTILGLLPLAIGFGIGAEMMQPVAIVCIGGLLYATLTTLLVIPIMYRIFAKKHMEKIQEEELEVVNV